MGKEFKKNSRETVVLTLTLPEPRMSPATCIPQSPSDWLLARYDRVSRRTFGPQGDGRRIRDHRGSNFERPIFDLLDDHPGGVCTPDGQGGCAFRSGEASWPRCNAGDDLDLELHFAQLENIV